MSPDLPIRHPLDEQFLADATAESKKTFAAHIKANELVSAYWQWRRMASAENSEAAQCIEYWSWKHLFEHYFEI
jgi:hypothetical protein